MGGQTYMYLGYTGQHDDQTRSAHIVCTMRSSTRANLNVIHIIPGLD